MGSWVLQYHELMLYAVVYLYIQYAAKMAEFRGGIYIKFQLFMCSTRVWNCLEGGGGQALEGLVEFLLFLFKETH
jgi:hypothetical protein